MATDIDSLQARLQDKVGWWQVDPSAAQMGGMQTHTMLPNCSEQSPVSTY